MIKRSIIVSLTIAAIVGTAASTGVAGPPAADPPSPADSIEFTMRVGKGRLGVAVLQISPELRAHLGAPSDRGVLVDAVKPDSPAARGGVRVGDVIVEVDGDAATSAADVLAAIGDRKKGEAVAIAAIRGGQRQELRATLEDDPGPARPRGRRPGRGAMGELGPWRGDLPSFGGLDPDARRSLEEARRRIEQLERRLERLERR